MNAFNDMQFRALVQLAPSVEKNLTEKARDITRMLSGVVLVALIAGGIQLAHADGIPGHDADVAVSAPSQASNSSQEPVPGVLVKSDKPVFLGSPEYEVTSLRVEPARPTMNPVARGAVVLGSGAVGGWGAHQIAKKYGANPVWANIFGVAGAGVASGVATAMSQGKATASGTGAVTNPGLATSYDPAKNEWRNGTQPLTEAKFNAMKDWSVKATKSLEALAQNRAVIENMQEALTFASPQDINQIRSQISSAINNDARLVQTFINDRRQISAIIWISAMDLNYNVPDAISLQAGRLNAVDPSRETTSAQLLNPSTPDLTPKKTSKLGR